MKKLVSLVMFALCTSVAVAQDPPAEKPPGGVMPGSDKPADGQMPGRPEGGTMPEASFAANASCSVEGSWYTLLPPSTKNPNGKQVTASFSGGTFTTTTAEGNRTSSYSISGSTVSFSKGNVGKPPKSSSGETRTACDPNAAGAYTAVFTSDCSALKLQATSDACESRKRVMEANTYRRDKKQ